MNDDQKAKMVVICILIAGIILLLSILAVSNGLMHKPTLPTPYLNVKVPIISHDGHGN